MSGTSILSKQRSPSPPTIKLFLSLFFILLRITIPYVSAHPLATRQSDTEADTPDANDDRSSTWQILADGTQDLAALIGLFATDSVERYAIDYSRGYLGAALAPCSMLGILGYVRALVKLAIGTDACVAAAFPTAPVRPLLGVPPQDRLPGDELVTVNYLRREVQRSDNTITWTRIKSVAHTKESMPATWAYMALPASSEQIGPTLFLLEAGGESKKFISRQMPPRKWHVVLAIFVSTATNSLLILSIGEKEWPWSKIVASFATFAFLFASSVVWSLVYMMEQVPIFGKQDPVCLKREGEAHRRPCGSISLETSSEKSQLVVIERAGSHILLPCATLSDKAYMGCRVFSGISAAVITLGYLCQYIVVRSSTENESLRWLLVQAALALVRVVVWVYPSRWIPRILDQKNCEYLHLPRPAFSDFQSSSGILNGSAISSYESFQELELATAFASFGVGLDEITVEQGAMKALQRIPLMSAFRKACAADDSYVQAVKEALTKSNLSWEVNPLLFRKLLLQRTEHPLLETLERSNEQVIGDSTCKMLDLAEKLTWEEAELALVPMVNVSFQLEALDSNGNVKKRGLEKGWCTCFSVNNPGVNLVEVGLVFGRTAWVPFDEVLPAPDGFRLGKYPSFRVSYETGEAGDLSIDSELTVDGYHRKWSSLSDMLLRVVSLQQKSAEESPQRWYIQYYEESPLLIENVHPEVAKPLPTSEGNNLT